jgi:transposase
MGNPAGVTRDFKALERRRLRGATLLERGVPQATVARTLGVSRETVRRWADQLKTTGRAGLKAARRAGRKPRLTDDQVARVAAALVEGPMAQGYTTELWTCARVRKLIETLTGVRYSTGHVWRILGELGWSCQRPTGRALERNEEAIRRWKRQRWPVLKKTPSGRAKRSSSSTKVD